MAIVIVSNFKWLAYFHFDNLCCVLTEFQLLNHPEKGLSEYKRDGMPRRGIDSFCPNLDTRKKGARNCRWRAECVKNDISFTEMMMVVWPQFKAALVFSNIERDNDGGNKQHEGVKSVNDVSPNGGIFSLATGIQSEVLAKIAFAWFGLFPPFY